VHYRPWTRQFRKRGRDNAALRTHRPITIPATNAVGDISPMEYSRCVVIVTSASPSDGAFCRGAETRRPHPMSGHRSFDQLRSRMSPERRARNAAATKEMLAEMALRELRQAPALAGGTGARPQGGPARGRQARTAHRHVCEQSAALYRGSWRLAEDHCAVCRSACDDHEFRGSGEAAGREMGASQVRGSDASRGTSACSRSTNLSKDGEIDVNPAR
jgi:hypothetical protein